MVKLKLISYYYRSILSFNLPFSLFIGVLSLPFNGNWAVGMINAFSLCLATGGCMLALYLYEQHYSGQYYFYHNQGLSRIELAGAAISVNLLLVFLLFLLKIYLLNG